MVVLKQTPERIGGGLYPQSFRVFGVWMFRERQTELRIPGLLGLKCMRECCRMASFTKAFSR